MHGELENHYVELESGFRVEEKCDLGYLARPNGNAHMPVHRWFLMKEGFSEQLLWWVLRELRFSKGKRIRVLDPFVGCGTTLVSAVQLCNDGWDISAYGVEKNPFLHFVAKTKSEAWRFDPDRCQELAKLALSRRYDGEVVEIPVLTTLHRKEVYSQERLISLLKLKQSINNLCNGHGEKDALLLAFASILERTSGTRKDGRALRFVERPQTSIRREFEQKVRAITEDLENARENPHKAKALIGDARDLSEKMPKDGQFDLVVYSPPYLNNIDYTEVYKIELWMLGLVNSYEESRRLRKGTFRSHPSVAFGKDSELARTTVGKEFNPSLEILNSGLPTDGNQRWRSRLFANYFDDVYRALLEQKRLVKAGGYVVCVVGNSLHGGLEDRVTVAVDLLVGRLAQLIGMDVQRILVVRRANRREKENEFLRESIIMMQKPERS